MAFYMNSITLITSVINTPNMPLSYSTSRSAFSKEERFEHTKKTINSIRQKIPNTKIFLIECSELSFVEREYFIKNVDFFFNIFDTNNEQLIQRIFSISKSMGEGTMTICAIKYLLDNNIAFDNLFKISGRYWLNDTFNYDLYSNNLSCVHSIGNDINNIFTCYYKLSKDLTVDWLVYLLNSEKDFFDCIGFEIIFAKFIKKYTNVNIINNKVGINGYVTVCGTYIDL